MMIESSEAVARRGHAVRALHTMAVASELARTLSGSGIDLLALKGPFLQERLYGTPAAYPSGDVDLLVHHADGAKVRKILWETGWRFEPENMFLWRLSRTATFERDDVRVDLHWGLHAGKLPSHSLRRLERALWEGADKDRRGVYQPALEPLVVYLAVHAASHQFSRSSWVDVVARACEEVSDWDRVWRLAKHCRVEKTLLRAMAVANKQTDAGAEGPILDGWRGRAWGHLFHLVRGRAVPQAARGPLRGPMARLAGRGTRVQEFAGLRLIVSHGVWTPSPFSDTLVDLALQAVAAHSHPRVVDVGTGSGALALAIAKRRTDAEVHAVDVSPNALRCAKANARRLGIRNVAFHLGDLLEPLGADTVDVIVSNAPYVPPGVTFPAGITSQMVHGGGFDGLELLRRLAHDARGVMRPGGMLVLQLADDQWDHFSVELARKGYKPIPPRERRPGRALAVQAELLPRSASA